MPSSLGKATARPAPGFGVYVHWPFCLAKCPYCDFNSHVRAHVDQDRWRRALTAELNHYRACAETAGPMAPVTSLFFGGGTPSLMPPETVAAVIDAVRREWPTDPDLEITLEANPTSVETDRLGAVVDAGVNRLSLGIQALNDTALRFLGRRHSARDALTALEVAARTGVRRSFDLIYGLPDQSADDWERDLRHALDRMVGPAAAPGGGHLSLYQLTIEAGTGFHAAVRRGDWTPLDDDRAADLFDLTQDLTAAVDMPAYEISNHARPGQQCRHNLTYWRGGAYVGVGPGAHGRLRLPATHGDLAWHATHQIRTPEAWLAAVEADGHATRAATAITPADRLAERLMMGLRTVEGLDLATLDPALDGDAESLDRDGLRRMTHAGLLIRSGSQLAASRDGMRLLNGVIAAILPVCGVSPAASPGA